MSDEIEAVTEGAKAVKEIAKFGQEVVKATSGAGRYLADQAGTLPADVIGLAGGDYIRAWRLANAEGVFAKFEEKVKRRGIDKPEPLSPRHLVEAIEAASDTSDETLQEMWANLLANAMDPNKDTSLQRVFIEALKQFEPIDALVLDAAVKHHPEGQFGAGAIARLTARRSTEIVVSGERLIQLGCFWADKRERIENFGVRPLGTELHLACSPDSED